MEPRQPWDLLENPAAQAARAQILAALLLAALLPITLLNWPIQQHKVALDLPPSQDVGVYFHGLGLDPMGRLHFDGEAVDFIRLRQRLDLAVVEGEGVDFRPDRNARYEMFLETLAVMKRAQVVHLRLDNRRLAGAIDE